MIVRRYLAIASVVLLASCQQLLGLDEGKVSTTGATGGGGHASTSVSTSAGGGTSSVSTSSTETSSATSSTTSTSGTGGTGGGGTGGGTGGVMVLPGNMIDDMEDGNAQILTQGGRFGSWFTYNDGTGTQSPDPASSCLPADGGHSPASLKSMHTTGTGFSLSGFGAGMGFDLNHPGTERLAYDAHAFTGVVFWAKGATNIHVMVLEPATVPVSAPGQGGTCTPMGSFGCGDSHRANVALTTAWKQYAVPFSSLAQAGWGVGATFDPSQVLSIQFAVDPVASFDFWIDEVGFY